jgi:hypothetical protein
MSIARVLTTEESGTPSGFVRVASKDGVLITWRSPGQGTCIALGFLGLVLGALLLVAAAQAPHMAGGLTTTAAIIAAASAYLLPAGLLNRTVLCLQQPRIAVRQRPLPCPWLSRFQAKRWRRIPVVDVYEVSVEEVPAPGWKGGEGPAYSLVVKTIGTGREVLLTRLSRDEAAYLKQEMGTFLASRQ